MSDGFDYAAHESFRLRLTAKIAERLREHELAIMQGVPGAIGRAEGMRVFMEIFSEPITPPKKKRTKAPEPSAADYFARHPDALTLKA